MPTGVARAKEMPDSPAAFWESFRGRLVSAVRDCNCEAGEALWIISERDDAPYRLEILSTAKPHGKLELLFDAGQACLSCTFGISPRDRWLFQLFVDRMALCRAATNYSIEDSVNAILDRLASHASAD
jgi:hypothetical protein